MKVSQLKNYHFAVEKPENSTMFHVSHMGAIIPETECRAYPEAQSLAYSLALYNFAMRPNIKIRRQPRAGKKLKLSYLEVIENYGD